MGYYVGQRVALGPRTGVIIDIASPGDNRYGHYPSEPSVPSVTVHFDSGGVEDIDPERYHLASDDYDQLAEALWRASPEKALDGDPYQPFRARYRLKQADARGGDIWSHIPATSGTHRVPVEMLKQWVDPNVPPDKLFRHEKPYMDALMGSMQSRGQIEPVHIKVGRDRAGKAHFRVLEGNHRVWAADALGMGHLDATFTSSDPEEEKADLFPEYAKTGSSDTGMSSDRTGDSWQYHTDNQALPGPMPGVDFIPYEPGVMCSYCNERPAECTVNGSSLCLQDAQDHWGIPNIEAKAQEEQEEQEEPGQVHEGAAYQDGHFFIFHQATPKEMGGSPLHHLEAWEEDVPLAHVSPVERKTRESAGDGSLNYDDVSKRVGTLNWHHSTGEIQNVRVEHGAQRQGLATELWRRAHEIASSTRGIKPPRHSPDRTPSGEAWARSVNKRLPRRSQWGQVEAAAYQGNHFFIFHKARKGYPFHRLEAWRTDNTRAHVHPQDREEILKEGENTHPKGYIEWRATKIQTGRPPPQGAGRIEGIGVHPDEQRQGLASELYYRARGIARETPGMVHPQHSPVASEEGKAWRQTLDPRRMWGTPPPPPKPSDNPDQMKLFASGHEAAWRDVMDKAKRMRADNAVHLLEVPTPDSPYVFAEVKGDNALHHCFVGVKGSEQGQWSCSCQWGDFGPNGPLAEERAPTSPYKKTPCSHILATRWELQSRSMFGRNPYTGALHETWEDTQHTPGAFMYTHRLDDDDRGRPQYYIRNFIRNKDYPKGTGADLLRQVTDRADRDGAVLITNTVNKADSKLGPYYQSFGFQRHPAIDGKEGSPLGPGYRREPHTGALHLAEMNGEDEVPEPLGKTHIPEGTIRLFHNTWGRNIPSIREHGLLQSYGEGDSLKGFGNEPSAGIWAATKHPAGDPDLNGPRADSDHHTVEFWAFPHEISQNASHYRGEDPEQWANSYSHHVIMNTDIRPRRIVAIHSPWHTAYRQVKSDRFDLEATKRGENDNLVDDSVMGKNLGRAIDKIKKEGTRHLAVNGPDEVPEEMGTTPIPHNHVRFFHQTPVDNVESIRQHGLQYSHARGIEGPKAIWTSTGKPFYNDSDDMATVEFHLPFDDPAVKSHFWQYKNIEDLDRSVYKDHVVPLARNSVEPHEITAIHEPWHRAYRYFKEDKDGAAKVKAGEFDKFTGPEWEHYGYPKAIDKIKREGSLADPLDDWFSGRFLYEAEFKQRVVVPPHEEFVGTKPYMDLVQPSGSQVRGTVIRHDDPSIPDHLYHVTTNLPAVKESGYLRAGGEGGLGGDKKDQVVSMTTDPEVAHGLERDIKFMAGMHQKHGPDRAWDDERGQEPERGQRIWDDFNNEAKKYNFKFDEPHPHQLRSYNLKDWATMFYQYRSSHGVRNPIFFGDLSHVNPDHVGTVKVPKKNLGGSGALITDFDREAGRHGLSEIRAYGDVPLEGAEFKKEAARPRKPKVEPASSGLWVPEHIMHEAGMGPEHLIPTHEDPEGTTNWRATHFLEHPEGWQQKIKANWQEWGPSCGTAEQCRRHMDPRSEEYHPEHNGTLTERAAVDHIKEAFYRVPSHQREDAKNWFPIIHHIVGGWSRETGLAPHGVAAGTAAASPHLDWPSNHSNAHFMAQMLSPNNDERFKYKSGTDDKTAPLLRKYNKSNFSDIEDPRHAAAAIYHYGKHTRNLQNEIGPVLKSGPRRGKMPITRWGYLPNLTKAVQAMRGDASPDEILKGHKIRSFHNNIVSPYEDPHESVTGDIHMVSAAAHVKFGSPPAVIDPETGKEKKPGADAASRLMTLPGSAPMARDYNTVGGYGFLAHVIRRAHKELVDEESMEPWRLPSATQSTSWEGHKAVSGAKGNEDYPYIRTRGDLEEHRNRRIESGPLWRQGNMGDMVNPLSHDEPGLPAEEPDPDLFPEENNDWHSARGMPEFTPDPYIEEEADYRDTHLPDEFERWPEEEADEADFSDLLHERRKEGTMYDWSQDLRQARRQALAAQLPEPAPPPEVPVQYLSTVPHHLASGMDEWGFEPHQANDAPSEDWQVQHSPGARNPASTAPPGFGDPLDPADERDILGSPYPDERLLEPGPTLTNRFRGPASNAGYDVIMASLQAQAARKKTPRERYVEMTNKHPNLSWDSFEENAVDQGHEVDSDEYFNEAMAQAAGALDQARWSPGARKKKTEALIVQSQNSTGNGGGGASYYGTLHVQAQGGGGGSYYTQAPLNPQPPQVPNGPQPPFPMVQAPAPQAVPSPVEMPITPASTSVPQEPSEGSQALASLQDGLEYLRPPGGAPGGPGGASPGMSREAVLAQDQADRAQLAAGAEAYLRTGSVPIPGTEVNMNTIFDMPVGSLSGMSHDARSRDFTPAEQDEMVREGELEGVKASNLHMLNLQGSMYEELERQLTGDQQSQDAANAFWW